ncbi:MAG: glycosyltransferase family 2 protein [Proteobacteria bacterium]|nr:glycosyltransferase family 2 protein [Pseudomonadota bacterium]
MKQGPHSLALVLIARDEARCIARCLESVKPHVDRMLVLDTGSTDATPALARAAGADVHYGTWNDDFSAARNHALALADADWNLVLDADEWLISGGADIAALRWMAPTYAGRIRVDSEYDSDAELSVAPSWLTRVVPRGARYTGRIHEQVDAAWPRRRIAVRIGHDGYHRARQTGKRGRNDRLLRMALDESPADAYLHYQLGKNLELATAWDAAAPHYETAYASGHPDDSWRHDLVLRLVYTLKKTCAFERAVLIADAEMARWTHSPDYYFTLADLLLDWATSEPERAKELLPMIEASWQQCLVLGDNPDLEGAVHGRGSFLAARNLAAFHESLGHAEQAARYARLEAELRQRRTAGRDTKEQPR